MWVCASVENYFNGRKPNKEVMRIMGEKRAVTKFEWLRGWGMMMRQGVQTWTKFDKIEC